MSIVHVWNSSNQPTSYMGPSPSPKANRSPVKKFRMFYGTQKLIATSTRARHLSLFSSQPIAFKTVLILSTARYFTVLRPSKRSVEVRVVPLLDVRDCLLQITDLLLGAESFLRS